MTTNKVMGRYSNTFRKYNLGSYWKTWPENEMGWEWKAHVTLLLYFTLDSEQALEPKCCHTHIDEIYATGYSKSLQKKKKILLVPTVMKVFFGMMRFPFQWGDPEFPISEQASHLTHWSLNNIWQTTISNAFCWMKSFIFSFETLWSLFLRVQLALANTGDKPLPEPALTKFTNRYVSKDLDELSDIICTYMELKAEIRTHPRFYHDQCADQLSLK